MIKELGYRRSDLVITTKLFFGTRSGPNDTGLSRKQFVTSTSFLYPRNHSFGSIIEGTQQSLSRLGLDYVDVIFAHRPDYTSQCPVACAPEFANVAIAPMEEIVRAFNFVIEKGWVGICDQVPIVSHCIP